MTGSRLLTGIGVAALLTAGAVAIWRYAAPQQPESSGPAAPTPDSMAAQIAATPAIAPANAAPAEPDREARRLSRTDKNKDGIVSRPEFLASRQRAYDKLDLNKDGRLSFEEYAARTIGRFDVADADRNGQLSAGEYATTAQPRRAPSRPADCPPCEPDADAGPATP
jgi:hypothetical protein